jgi:hypothetical protein
LRFAPFTYKIGYMNIDEKNFSFNESMPPKSAIRFAGTEQEGMAGFLIKKGIVKNATQANIVLLSMALLALVAAAFIFIKSFDIKLTTEQREAPKRYIKNI